MNRTGTPPQTEGAEDERLRTASMTLPPDPSSARSARELLRLLNRSWHVAALDDADLLLTEIVTNAVIHARTPMTLQVVWERDLLRIEVSDGSPAMPRARRATRRCEHGRGLLLLDRLADSWGVTQHDNAHTGKTVWFKINPDGDDNAPDDPDLHAAFDIDTVDAL